MNLLLAGAALVAAALGAACGATPDASTPDETPAGFARAEAARRAVVTPDTMENDAPRTVVINGVDLTGIGYDRGSATAPVVVVNFSDFGCPYCAEFAQRTEPVIDEEYVRTGKVFMKYVPFVIGTFPNAVAVARAAECAGEQGRFLAMHDVLYRNQDEWKGSRDVDGLVARYASGTGIDRAAFAACYGKDGMHPRTGRATAAADRLGLRVTPSFIVNGRPVEGAVPLPQFRQLLDGAIAGRGR